MFADKFIWFVKMDPSVVAFDDTTKSHDSDKELCSSSSLPDQQEDLGEKSSHTTPSDDKGSKSTDSVREEGLRAFRAGDWRGATDAWSRGLRTLEYILAKEDEFDDDKKREFAAVCSTILRTTNGTEPGMPCWLLSLCPSRTSRHACVYLPSLVSRRVTSSVCETDIRTTTKHIRLIALSLVLCVPVDAPVVLAKPVALLPQGGPLGCMHLVQ